MKMDLHEELLKCSIKVEEDYSAVLILKRSFTHLKL